MPAETPLTALSLSLIALMGLHLSQDIAFGFETGGPAALAGVLILAVWLSGAMAPAGRRARYMILLVGSVLASMMPVIHMSGAGVEADVVQSGGGLLFLWTLMMLGAGGGVSAALSAHGLWRREQGLAGAVLWGVVALGAGAALLGGLTYLGE